jgi:hypothetical protein
MFGTFRADKRIDVEAFSERKRRVYDFLQQNQIGVLSTVSPNGDPHGTVLYFSLAKDFTVTFLTRTGTRKFDDLSLHKQVVLTVYEAESQTTVEIFARAEQLTDGSEINAVAARTLATSMKTSGAGLPPIVKLREGAYTAFRLHPTQIRMAIYSRPDPGEYADLFEVLESFEIESN